MSPDSVATTIVASAFGGPEVLAVLEQPLREPGAGEVALDVRAAGVNPIDWKVYSGSMGSDESRLPMGIGFEAAGVISAVGPEAMGPAGPIVVGDAVIGYPVAGAYADRVVTTAESLVPKPESLSFEEAGGLFLVGGTAIHALTVTEVGEGDTLLLHAASGGVGVLAIQLAILRGARVIGTASAARQDEVRALGAEPVVYGDGLADRVRELAPDGVDAAIDAAGTDEALDVSLELVADRDRIATIANFGRGFEVGIKVLGGAPGADGGDAIRQAARLELAELAGAGKLTLTTTAVPLAQAAGAHRDGIAGKTRGKVVLVP